MQVLSVSTELHQRCPLLTLHQLHEDGDPGALLDSTVQGHHAGARHSRARRQLLGTEMFHLHLQKERHWASPAMNPHTAVPPWWLCGSRWVNWAWWSWRRCLPNLIVTYPSRTKAVQQDRNTWDDKPSMSNGSENTSQEMPACNNSRLHLRMGTLQEKGNFCLSKKIILTTERVLLLWKRGRGKNPGDDAKLGKNSTPPKQEGIQNTSTSIWSNLHDHLVRWCSFCKWLKKTCIC